MPSAPELPPRLSPRIWQGLSFVLVLLVCFAGSYSTIEKDGKFLKRIQSAEQKQLRNRPLLEIAPSREAWDLRRLFLANFFHVTPAHLFFNLVGVFAGARLCSCFIPFGCTFAIFVLGGCAGFALSLFLSPPEYAFVPHLGASAGIFSLMGAYYVYNFHFRTRYFFWFPMRRRQVAFDTKWFFFFDVIFLELLFSAVQLFPGNVEVVDHVSHVGGFVSGVGLALVLRVSQRWPWLIQSRQEFLYWSTHRNSLDNLETLFNLLKINGYNDAVKKRICKNLNSEKNTGKNIEVFFNALSPTFIRLFPEHGARIVQFLMENRVGLNTPWLASLPYDSVLQLAGVIAANPENYPILIRLLTEYQAAQKVEKGLDAKLEMLIRRLGAHAELRSGIPVPLGFVRRDR